MLMNTENDYGSVTKFLHWLIFFVVISLLIVGFLMDGISNKQIKIEAFMLHKTFGMIVLALMAFRLVWTSVNPRPMYPITTPFWQRIATRTVHALLYILLIAMPLSGWIMSTAK